MKSVYCALRAGSLTKAVWASSLEGWTMICGTEHSRSTDRHVKFQYRVSRRQPALIPGGWIVTICDTFLRYLYMTLRNQWRKGNRKRDWKNKTGYRVTKENVLSFHEVARYTKINNGWNIIISEKLIFTASPWSVRCRISQILLTTYRNAGKIQNLVQDNRFSCRYYISWFYKHEISDIDWTATSGAYHVVCNT